MHHVLNSFAFRVKYLLNNPRGTKRYERVTTIHNKRILLRRFSDRSTIPNRRRIDIVSLAMSQVRHKLLTVHRRAPINDRAARSRKSRHKYRVSRDNDEHSFTSITDDMASISIESEAAASAWKRLPFIRRINLTPSGVCVCVYFIQRCVASFVVYF